MSEKLTSGMREVLRFVSDAGQGIWFATGEALRRRGLLVRHTTYVIRVDYADESGVHTQYELPSDRPNVRHEWQITPAGRQALGAENV